MFTSASEVIDIIEQRKNRGYGIDHFKEYMKTIDNPHLKLKAIHVAGTNGKGSTTNDIRSILQEAGYRVGTFTSPYMITHLDRIRINDKDIEEREFLEITNEFYESWMAWDLSMFEIDMCIASVYFLRKHVDFCVFEVGLGGRLDLTNILNPLLCLITNIGLDHMEILGDTYEKIAIEKAGIVKERTVLITAEEKEECLQIFKTKAKQMNTICVRISDVTNIYKEKRHIYFDYGAYNQIELASGAKYQVANAALAIEAVHYLHKEGYAIVNEQQIREGLRKAIWIGRFEVVQHNPFIMLDGAHNVDGVRALCDSVRDIHHPVIVFSVLKDKNFTEMIAQLETISDYIIITQLQHNERALDIHTLHERQHIYVIDDMDEALQQALQQRRPIIITGSLYFISDMRAKYFAPSTTF